MRNLRWPIKMADILLTTKTRLAKSVNLMTDKIIFKQQKSLNLKNIYLCIMLIFFIKFILNKFI